MTEAEKQELENQRMMKEQALQVAMQQLKQLELERKEALEQYEEVKKKLETAANNTKSWKDKVAHHEGLIRLIEPGSKNPHFITNWGPAAFTEAELEERQRSWKGKKATSEWQWQLMCGPEQEPTSPRSALHRAASRLQNLVCSAGWAFLLVKWCLPGWSLCSELSHYSVWCLTGSAVFPHISKTLQLKICTEM